MVLNEEISKFIEEQYGDLFETHGCYENVFKLITGDLPELFGNNMKALFCYAYNGIYYYRHAFCMIEGEIIEPLGNVREGLVLSKLIPISELMFKEYTALIMKVKLFNLNLSLFPQEIKIMNENKRQMAKINPVDANAIVTRLEKTADDALLLLQNLLSGKGIPEKYAKIASN